jgi:hypothetical protein
MREINLTTVLTARLQTMSDKSGVLLNYPGNGWETGYPLSTRLPADGIASESKATFILSRCAICKKRNAQSCMHIIKEPAASTGGNSDYALLEHRTVIHLI